MFILLFYNIFKKKSDTKNIWDRMLNRFIQSSLLELCSASQEKYVCVPMQGSGTFAVESTIMTSLKHNPNGKVTLTCKN